MTVNATLDPKAFEKENQKINTYRRFTEYYHKFYQTQGLWSNEKMSRYIFVTELWPSEVW